MQGFLNHYRMAHDVIYSSHDEAATICGTEVPVSEIPLEDPVLRRVHRGTSIDMSSGFHPAQSLSILQTRGSSEPKIGQTNVFVSSTPSHLINRANSKSSMPAVPLMHQEHASQPFYAAAETRFHKRRIVRIGNVSRFVPENERRQSERKIPFEWLIFLTGVNFSDNPESFVTRVRFIIDDSYRPNNVIDLEKPPFQVRRVGWSEFNVKAILFLADEAKNKPCIHEFLLKVRFSLLKL